jgi:hypothetical protein
MKVLSTLKHQNRLCNTFIEHISYIYIYIYAVEEGGIGVNAEKSKYMLIFRHQNAAQTITIL